MLFRSPASPPAVAPASPPAGPPPGTAANLPTGNGTSAPAIPGAQTGSVFTPRRSRQAAAAPASLFTFGAGPQDHPDGPDTMEQQITPAQLTEMGLPVRVRQASLAPQLRDGGTFAADAAGDSPGAPSPEAVRGTMTAMQKGWERGRDVPAMQAPSPDTTLSPQPSENGGEQRNDE